MCVAARGPGGSRWAPQKGKIEENSMKGLYTDVWRSQGLGEIPGSAERAERRPQQEQGL